MTTVNQISIGQEVIYSGYYATVKQICAYSVKIVSPLFKDVVWVPISQIKIIY